MNMKKLALVVLCLILTLTLAGCTAVNSANSFQGQASDQVIGTETQPQTETQQQVAPGPTAEPTQDPNSSGFNG